LVAKPGCFFFNQAPSVTADFLRQVLTIGISMDRTIRPSGTIQKPRTGRKPKTPPTISEMPMAILASLLAGSLNVRPAMVIFGMCFNWGCRKKLQGHLILVENYSLFL